MLNTAPACHVDVEWDSDAVKVNQQAFRDRTSVRRLTLNDRTVMHGSREEDIHEKVREYNTRQLYLTALNYTHTPICLRGTGSHTTFVEDR